MAESPSPLPWTHLMEQFKLHKAKVITILVTVAVILVGGTIAVNAFLDQRAELAQQKAIIGTLSEKVVKIDGNLTTANHVLDDQREVTKQVIGRMGQQINDYMTNNNATIRALYTALGRIEQEVRDGKPVTVTPDKDGGFHDVRLTQARTGPATTEVALTYSPNAPDPTKRLLPVWTNYREDFLPSLGEWQRKDKGFAAAFRLKRNVYRADPTAPGGYVLVGTEDIDLKDAQASYNQDVAFPVTGALKVPRWSVILGAGRDLNLKKTVPVGLIGYRMTDRFGIHTGAVGNVFVLGGSYQFSLGN